MKVDQGKVVHANMKEILKQLEEWMESREKESLEFKEAKNHYDFEKLVKYCAALANEGGGRMILGVTDTLPRKVVGTKAFQVIERTKAGLIERLYLRIDADEVAHPDGRVLVFKIPSRPPGMAIEYKGAYWMRGGQDLVPMTPDLLKRIFDEVGPDFTAEICRKASLRDLDPKAINQFRMMWLKKSGNPSLEHLSDEQLLTDAELIIDGDITFAALIMFGTRPALGKYISQAEVIFEYRASGVSGPSQQREEYRQGFFLFLDDLWSKINLRNEMQHFQDGLFIWNIPTFSEVVIREAILNAVAHRDYRLGASIFVRQFPRKLEIVSPGGFPPGITPENILWRQSPRNRRIAETLARCGLVERSGQGVNRMFEECIKESKPRPDFSNSDDYQVSVILRGEMQDQNFLRFLEKIGREKLASFTTEDFLFLDLINREETMPPFLKPRLPHLVNHGIIEKIGRGKGVRYILSRRFYKFIEKKGVYTRKRGLDHETNKMLLLKHIQENQKEGSKFRELKEVLPSLSRGQIQTLLKELKREGRIYHIGSTRAALWYSGRPEPN